MDRTTIVGLYDDLHAAQRVERALLDGDFDRDHTYLLAHDETGSLSSQGSARGEASGTASNAFTGDLVNTLTSWNVPRDEAEFYEEGLRRGGHVVITRTREDHVEKAVDIMNGERAVDMEERRTEYLGDRSATQRGTARQEERIPVTEEELRVGKRQVQRGGVRVHTRIEETPVREDVTVRDEEIHVERRKVDRPVEAGEDAFQERTVEMTETDEEVVVDKTARVTEEVVIDKDVHERTETVEDTVRRTRIEIDEDAGTPRRSESLSYSDEGFVTGFRDAESDFRTHHGKTYDADSYDRYQDAYHYGFAAAQHENYRSREYDAAESDLRRRYDEQNSKGSFNNVREAIRTGYARGRRS